MNGKKEFLSTVNNNKCRKQKTFRRWINQIVMMLKSWFSYSRPVKDEDDRTFKADPKI
ncbi:6098_t:CDS:2 [Entrophospora sp. SA101]|nr:6098_t:CDS:2 [Entrophospora sp. SA101]